tara:strand:- start:144 stop:1202 length:1059 start_codon:yes stop_codon:yes gene_type:complete
MNYLIIRNDGIGDLILSTPLILAIRKIDPDSRIHLLCSERNYAFALILIEEKIIDEVHLLKSKSNFFALYKKLLSIRYEKIFILKASLSNLFFSIILKANNIFSIVAINKGKIFKNRYSPPLLFTKIFLNAVEFIDCRNNYRNSRDIHMSTHFLNLMNTKTQNTSFNKNYYYPKKLNKKSKDYINYLNRYLNLSDNKKIVIFHFDEKWDNYNYNFEEIKNFISDLNEKNQINLIITNGIIKNKYEDRLITDLELKKKDPNTYISLKNDNILFLNNLSLKKLFYIIQFSYLVITPHGSLTHIASLYNVNLVDLIPFERKDFFLKWKSPNINNIQCEIRNLKEITKVVTTYLET